MALPNRLRMLALILALVLPDMQAKDGWDSDDTQDARRRMKCHVQSHDQSISLGEQVPCVGVELATAVPVHVQHFRLGRSCTPVTLHEALGHILKANTLRNSEHRHQNLQRWKSENRR
ncbi:hypothetical protein PoB_001822200 [Plakobranchus ocellatus]|uniref:Secreted protein n=1 Tax=Plakobranchus ocellatus TaxID=259542 RepID=A0AAV3ZB06_9GAST|nr:hypothetical protein PoB_001822200 [Plakobranchus ocellatus]